MQTYLSWSGGKDSTQFVAQGFKYGKTFDELIVDVENYKEENEGTQLTLFDIIGVKYGKEND